ncbi:MAG: hypothetical protein J5792_03680, partial [Bacteroidales bacterium]|nr:hypothetical protein [Bacteroidales bacterium]
SADVCELELEPTNVYAITPSITYLPDVVFDFKEDFEDAGIKFQPVDKSVGMSKTSDPSQVFRYLNEKSNYSGLIRLLPEDSSFFEVETSKTFVKSSKATYYFLEMNYCFTHNVEVGIYYHYGGRNYQYPICGIYGYKERGGASGWKKAYVNLSEAVNSIQVSDYEVYFKGIRKGTDTALYLFDNIKVLYN